MGRKKKATGLGDTIEQITEATGIKAAVELFSKVTGIDCGCEERKAKLNNLISYRRNVNCLKEDEYLFLKVLYDNKTNKLTPKQQHTIKDIYLNVESAYKIAATDNDQNHLQHTIGFVYFYKKGYKAPVKEVIVPTLPVVVAPVEQPKILDADKDGVNDDVDQCPTIAGLAKFNGCPDTDNDGIADNKDTCPLVSGLAAFNGCPDTDADGIADNTDACPYVAGVASRNGCPIPDTDGDGFNDEQDKCPSVFSKVNNGCPEIKKEIIERVNKAANSIYFETGKSIIKPVSFKDLDAVVKILNGDATLRVDIGGHTDNAGTEEGNITLSHDRAKAVNDYLISKGIAHERLTYEGYGSSKPVNNNVTEADKAQNRRTELNLRNY